jgi:hypothetical protein
MMMGTCENMCPPLAQSVRAQSLYLWGPWFESKRADRYLHKVAKGANNKKDPARSEIRDSQQLNQG